MTDDFTPTERELVEILLEGYELKGKRLLIPTLNQLPMEQTLRILVITNLYPPQELGGYGRSIYDFVNNLRLLGHNVQVLSSNASYLGGDISQDSQVDRSLNLLGTYEGGVSEITEQNSREYLIEINRKIIAEQMNSFRPDTVLLGNLDMLGHQLIWQIIENNTPCWHHYGFSNPPFSSMQLPPPEKPYYPLANSHYSSQTIHKQLAERAAPQVIYPGAQTHLFSDLETTPLGGTLKIAFAGLLIGAKGAHVLLEALTSLNALNIPFTCEIAGGHLSDEYPKALKKYIQSTGLDKRVKLLGKLERHELRELLSRNSVFVFPSTWEEPFGISQVEALAAGCLVVSSGTGGAGETVHDDINGRRFRSKDSAHLAAVLCEIYKQPQYHEKLRQRGRQLAKSHFNTARETYKLSNIMIKHIGKDS